ncbi:hypothetical protein K1W69_17095 [Hoeflea sp. WL0058]|uniref:Uncharacterized protein n=1 Tax=Flavimaribacter sediminis TaxID=2865987 RepID=A0AAE3D2J9_9HYPH|nr:hypothetical protein [Flavimaribacter sediminis]MBW8638916.1 hypothetical protein [Flavimaribacter sediminis]
MSNLLKALPLAITLSLSTFAAAHAADERVLSGEWLNANTNDVIGTSIITFAEDNSVTDCFTSKTFGERCFTGFTLKETEKGLEFGNRRVLYVLTADGDGYKAERFQRNNENEEFSLVNTATLSSK